MTRALDIDRAKLRAALRKLGDEYVFYMLDEAIELLPPTKLKRIVGKYLDPKQLRPDGGMPLRANLLDDVKAFEKASLAGKYYEPFMVNSQNFMSKSTGTQPGSRSAAGSSIDASSRQRPRSPPGSGKPSTSSSAFSTTSTRATKT